MDQQELLFLKQKEIELNFAACLFINPNQAIQECGWLDPDVILNEKIRELWRKARRTIMPGMFAGSSANEQITSISMEIGITAELLSATKDIYSSTVPAAYAREISRRAYIAGQSDSAAKLINALRISDDEQVREIINSMAAVNPGTVYTLPGAIDVATEFENIVNLGNRSIPFNIPALDRATGGQERQTLTIIAARPSIGKTAMGWQIAQMAAYAKKRVIFVSLEMSAANLWGRAACPKVGTTWRDVRAGKLSKEQKERLIEESYALALNFENNLSVIDTPQTSETIWRMTADQHPDLVVVDHLRLVGDQGISEVKRLGNISQKLKNIAKSFNCAVLLLAQLNRQSEVRPKGDKRPILADLRDSGEIEENGDLILMLHREEFDGEKKPEKSITEVWIRKFRDGPRDALVKLLFDPKQEWFEEFGK